jgi:hypothetical protein
MQPFPQPFTEELLPTRADEVTEDLHAAAAAVCTPAAWVRAAYGCRVRHEHDQADPEERLAIAVEPVAPLTDDGRRLWEETTELLLALPDALQKAGLSVLAEAAVSAWKQYGVCVFERQ